MATCIEFCPLDAADVLMAFIRDHWSPHHVLARSRKLLDWQHRNEADGRYNFLIARDDTDAIIGILGFIPSSRFDPALADAETVWLTTWKVRDGAPAGLGLILLRNLDRRLGARWIGTAGLNPQTRGIYEALGYRTGKLDRHYRLNAAAEPTLSVVPPDWPVAPSSSGDGTLREIGRDAFPPLDLTGQVPAKSPALFIERYLAHPFYRYRLLLAEHRGATCVLALRRCEHERAAALRIVDLIGDPAALAGCGAAFDALMAAEHAEYLDFYCSGATVPLSAAGFRIIDKDGPLILPSYFEPFELSNVDILWSLKGAGDPVIICKGDADQDRPNMLDA